MALRNMYRKQRLDKRPCLLAEVNDASQYQHEELIANLAYLVIVCVKRYLSANDFVSVARVVVVLRGHVPHKHLTSHFYDEFGDCLSTLYLEKLIRLMRHSPTLCVSWDEKDGCLVISMRLLK